MAQRNFKPASRTYDGYKKELNIERDRHQAMYHTDSWTRYRHRFLKENPYCYSCNNRANVVDHLIPHKGDAKLFEKLDNHIPLCVSCHNMVTALFDKSYKPGQSIEKKVAWLSRERLTAVGMDWPAVKVLGKYK